MDSKIETKKSCVSRKLFISYCLLLILTIGIMTAFISFKGRQTMNEQINLSDIQMLRQLSASIDEMLLKKVDNTIVQMMYSYKDLTNLYNHPLDGNRMRFVDLTNYMNGIKSANPEIASIYIYFPMTEVVVADFGFRYLSDARQYDNYDLSWLDYYRSNYNDTIYRKPVWLKSHIEKENPDGTLLQNDIIYSIRPFLEIKKGIIGISIDPKQIYNVIKNVDPSYNNIIITNERWEIISASNKSELYTDVLNEISRSRNNQEGYFTGDIHGEDMIISYVTSPYNSWRYISIQPQASVFKDTSIIYMIVLSACIIAVIIGLLISYFTTKVIYMPLKRLTSWAQNMLTIEKNNCSDNVVFKTDEYSIIAKVLNEMNRETALYKTKLNTYIPLIKNSLILNLINGNVFDHDRIDEILKTIQIDMPFKQFGLVIFSIDDYKKIRNSMGVDILETLKIQAYETIDAGIGHPFKLTGYEISTNEFICIVNFDVSDDDFMADLQVQIAQIQKKLAYDSGISISVGIGGTCDNISDVVRLYDEARGALNYRFILGSSAIIHYDDIKIRKCRAERFTRRRYKYLYGVFAEKLNDSDVIGSSKASNDLIDEMADALWDVEEVRSQLFQIASAVVTRFADYLGNDESFTDNSELADKMNAMETLTDFRVWLNDLFERIRGNPAQKADDKTLLIEQVKAFIKKNIDKDITVDIVACKLSLSANYISKLFKEQTGENLGDFIIEERLQYAKVLLETTDMQINEITDVIGYSSPQYFIKKFKDRYGFSPKRYRLNYNSAMLDPIKQN